MPACIASARGHAEFCEKGASTPATSSLALSRLEGAQAAGGAGVAVTTTCRVTSRVTSIVCNCGVGEFAALDVAAGVGGGALQLRIVTASTRHHKATTGSDEPGRGCCSFGAFKLAVTFRLCGPGDEVAVAGQLAYVLPLIAVRIGAKAMLASIAPAATRVKAFVPPSSEIQPKIRFHLPPFFGGGTIAKLESKDGIKGWNHT
jgi:hypothetical protein